MGLAAEHPAAPWPRGAVARSAFLVAVLAVCFIAGTQAEGAPVSSPIVARSKPCDSFSLATLIVKSCVNLPISDEMPRNCCAAVYLTLGQDGCICAVKVRGFFLASPLHHERAMDMVLQRCRASPAMYQILHGCDDQGHSAQLPTPILSPPGITPTDPSPPAPAATTPPKPAPKSPAATTPPKPAPKSPAATTPPKPAPKSPAATHPSAPVSKEARDRPAGSTCCRLATVIAVMGWIIAALFLAYILYQKYTSRGHPPFGPEIELRNNADFQNSTDVHLQLQLEQEESALCSQATSDHAGKRVRKVNPRVKGPMWAT